MITLVVAWNYSSIDYTKDWCCLLGYFCWQDLFYLLYAAGFDFVILWGEWRTRKTGWSLLDYILYDDG